MIHRITLEPAAFHTRAIIFLAIFLIMAVPLLLTQDLGLPHDSGYYWDISSKFTVNGRFSFLNYEDHIRGYLLPFINLVIIKLSKLLGLVDLKLFRLLMAALFSTLVVLVIPGIVKKNWNVTPKSYQIILFWLIILFFWRGYLLYPLSDFISLFFLTLALFFTLDKPLSYWKLLFSGLCMGAAVIIRPSFIASVPFYGTWILYKLYQDALQTRRGIRTAALLICAAIGFIIPLIPQYQINVHSMGINSPLVSPTTKGADLFIMQINYGLEMQKYETYSGLEARPAGVKYLDPQSLQILYREGFRKPSSSGTGESELIKLVGRMDLLRLILKYPLDFTAIYTRHLINGLDVVYDTIYIQNLQDRLIPIRRLLNFSMVFLSILFAVFIVQRKKVTLNELMPLAMFVAPCLLSIPGAVEVRFFLPLFLVIYTAVIYGLIEHIADVRRYVREHWALILTFYAIFMLLIIIVTTSVSAMII